MSPSPTRLFTQKDLDRIQDAVRAAEAGSSGEVVPFVVPESDDYGEADLRAAVLTGLLPLVVLLILRKTTQVWLALDPLEVMLLLLAGMAIGWGASSFIPAVRRLFAGGALMDRRVAQRAAEAFIAEEVFRTRERTGILLFISVLEHRVVVLGDAGINARVRPEEWQEVVTTITAGIKSGRHTEAITHGIALCGALLQKNGFVRRPDDADELPNRLRSGS
jgi:putative membrane protein